MPSDRSPNNLHPDPDSAEPSSSEAVVPDERSRDVGAPERRPRTDRDWDTDELPDTPQRDFLIPATRWRNAPAWLVELGADFGVELVAYKRRIGRYLLWRAGPAKGADACYAALASDDLQRSFTFRLRPDGTGAGVGADGSRHDRFRTWKESLRDDVA